MERSRKPNPDVEAARREKLDTLPCQKLFFQFAVLSLLLLFGRFGIVRGHTFHLRPPLCRFLFLQPPPISAWVIRMRGHALRELGGCHAAGVRGPDIPVAVPPIRQHTVLADRRCSSIIASRLSHSILIMLRRRSQTGKHTQAMS